MVEVLMPRHTLTAEESQKGWRLSARVRRQASRLMKRELNIKSREGWLDLLKSAVGQPVVAGVLMYLSIMAIEQIMTDLTKPATTTTKPFGFDIFQSLMDILTGKGTSQDVGTVGIFATNPLIGLTEEALAAMNWDFAALKTAIILYIASGGNLAGLLTSAGGLLSGPLTALISGLK